MSSSTVLLIFHGGKPVLSQRRTVNKEKDMGALVTCLSCHSNQQTLNMNMIHPSTNQP